MSLQTVRVLHITASSTIGGGPEHVWQLIRHLPHPVENFVAAPPCAPYGQRFVDVVGQERFLAIPQRKFTLKAFISLLGFLKKHNIDIIHSHGKGAGIYGRLAACITGVKSVHTFHGIHLPQNTFFRYLYKTLELFLCSISRVCISVSHGEYIHAKELGLCPHGLTTIYNGIPIPTKLEEREPPKPFTLLHVSRFDKAKNSILVYHIAKALEQKKLLPQCHFILVGDGDDLEHIKLKVQEENLTKYFQFEGVQATVSPYYEKAACLISTSLREGLPLAVLEAQAHGLPCVISDVVGNRDAIIADKTGFLFPLEDADGAASHIEKLLLDESLWKTMRTQAYAHAQEHFHVQKMADACEKVYKHVLH